MEGSAGWSDSGRIVDAISCNTGVIEEVEVLGGEETGVVSRIWTDSLSYLRFVRLRMDGSSAVGTYSSYSVSRGKPCKVS